MYPEPTRVAAAHLVVAAQITEERVGRRVYLRGNTYPVKEELRDLGAKWDRDERAWWVSTTKYRKYQEEISALVSGGRVPMATRKQVEYLVRLQTELGQSVDRRSLEKTPMSEVSQLISDLKKELGSRPSRPSGGGASRPSGGGASEKQVAYAVRLLDRLGRHGWHDSDWGQGMSMPSRSDLEGWPRSEVSALIDSLRREF